MINTLVEKIQKTNAPIVVGLDPMLKYIPEQIQKAAFTCIFCFFSQLYSESGVRRVWRDSEGSRGSHLAVQ